MGAGAGLFLPKEALQAYFIQQLLGPAGLPLTPVHLLYLATRAGARALGLDDRVGDFAVGKDFDAVWLRPADGSTLAVNLRHARDTTDALARIFALATPADVAGVWIRGERSGLRPRRSGPADPRSLAERGGAVGPPAAVAGDVLVDAEGVLGLAEHHGERQLAALELDDGELELGGFGGQQRAQRAHGHVVQLAEDRLAALGDRVEAGNSSRTEKNR